ncbi:MAG TPA: hypothetical protein VI979_03150 [archaeon]|nr:hypothetical protein [archaeon]
MAVVRVDEKLLREVKKVVDGDHSYDYPSIAAFVNKAIYEKLRKKDDKA